MEAFGRPLSHLQRFVSGLICLVVLATISSCGDSDWNPSDRMRITSDIFVSLQQQNGQVFLRSRTKEIYNASNNKLVTEIDESKDVLNVKYRYIDKCDSCTAALGPASSLIELPYADDLEVVFMLKGKKCSGTISNGEIELEKEGIIRVE